MDKNIFKKIALAIEKQGGQAYFVGGSVRDKLLGNNNHDLDIEVYNLELDRLIGILSNFGRVDIFGKSFGIIKLKGLDADFSMPRKERSTGLSHRDFEISIDPYLSVYEASKRRDFTMNAILENILSGEIIDCHKGQEDIDNRIIRHIDDESFVEDPLRTYRAVQFAARLEFTIAEETIKLCKKMDLSHLARERVFDEIMKLLLKADRPSIGLRYMKEMDIIKRYFPLLAALEDTDQDLDFHPEGNVWIHSLMVVDEAAKLRSKSKYPDSFMLAALLHDIGKPATSEFKDGRIRSHGHDRLGTELTEEFLKKLTDDKRIISQTKDLVRHHMRPNALFNSEAKPSAYRRLANSCDLEELLLLAEADFKGRGGDPMVYEEEFLEILSFLDKKFDELNIKKDEKLKPLIRGRDLIALGLKPGKHFGPILDRAFEMQLEGRTKEEILEAIKSNI